MNETLETMLKQIGKTYRNPYSRSNDCHDENEAIIAYSLASIALSLEKIAAMMEANGGYNFPDQGTETDPFALDKRL